MQRRYAPAVLKGQCRCSYCSFNFLYVSVLSSSRLRWGYFFFKSLRTWCFNSESCIISQAPCVSGASAAQNKPATKYSIMVHLSFQFCSPAFPEGILSLLLVVSARTRGFAQRSWPCRLYGSSVFLLFVVFLSCSHPSSCVSVITPSSVSTSANALPSKNFSYLSS